jgi:hypothetical protein
MPKQIHSPILFSKRGTSAAPRILGLKTDVEQNQKIQILFMKEVDL